MLLFSVAIAAILVEGGYTLPSSGQTCHSSLAPPTDARGVNRLDRNSNIPLFQLAVANRKETSLSLDQSLTYKVEVSAMNEQFPFSEVRISVAAISSCGIGSLTFDHHHFIDAKQSGSTCPRLVLTNRKLPMVELPNLAWKPPPCGCVQIRAVIISLDNVYYSDNEEVENGPLTQTICVHQKTPREIYLSALCQVQEKYSAAEIISRNSFLQRHQVEVKWMDRHGLEMGLELRRSDNKICCSKYSLEDKEACFDDSRRRRVDRFCEDGYPDLPLTYFRRKHMREREKECCFLLGEHRYSCFAEDSDLIQGPGVTLLDFSQDETDPVNDLAEFASVEDPDVIKSIEAIAKRAKDSDDDNSKDNDEGDTNKDDDDKVDDTASKQPGSQLSAGKMLGQTASGKTPVEGSRSDVSATRDFGSFKVHGESEGTISDKRTAQEDNTPLSSSSERRKTSRKVGEHEIKQSAERKSSRRVSNTDYTADGRRAERTGRKRASGERKQASGSYPTLPGYGEMSPRGTGQSREPELVSSAERRARGRASGQKRQDGLDSQARQDGLGSQARQDGLGSQTRQDGLDSQARQDGLDSQARQDGLEGLEAVDEPNIEDQGGKSVDETLDILQRKMDRLQLKHRCCEAGARAGRFVYGWRSPVLKECEHSRHKYMTAMEFPTSGIKSCLSQFLKCCMEQAVSGPVVSSSEFKDKFKPGGVLRKASSYERRNDLAQPAVRGQQRKTLPLDTPGFESPEAYERDSERRFQSMRENEQTPNENDDEEINGPRKFDEADNDIGNKLDILDRKDKTDDETDDNNDNDFVDREEIDESREFKEDILNVQTKQKKENGNKKGLRKGNNKKEATRDQLDRESDFFGSLEKQDSKMRGSNEGLLLAKTSSGRARNNYRNNRGSGRSQGSRSSSRESRQRASRESRQRVSRESSPSSQERRHYAQTYYSNYRPYKVDPSGKIGTQDSQEMVSAHAKKFVANLDSKEMVDAYKKKSPDNTEVLNDEAKQTKPRKRQHKRPRRRFMN